MTKPRPSMDPSQTVLPLPSPEELWTQTGAEEPGEGTRLANPKGDGRGMEGCSTGPGEGIGGQSRLSCGKEEGGRVIPPSSLLPASVILLRLNQIMLLPCSFPLPIAFHSF